MKHLFVLSCLAILLMSCNENRDIAVDENVDVESEIPAKEYPANITKVFEAHGGLDSWNAMQTLEFTMNEDDGNTVITTDLKSRKALLKTDKFRIGFDGNEAWVDQDSTYFNNDPNFYYDLMFYFYAMPFVLADDGITYSDVEPLQFEGTSYPGVKVSYDDGVGVSPEDEYILYYNPESSKMEWLSYTVTYFSKEKSDKYSYIKYNEWQDVNGVQLPKTLQWYKTENDSLTTMKNQRTFSTVKLMKEDMPTETYMKPKK